MTVKTTQQSKVKQSKLCQSIAPQFDFFCGNNSITVSLSDCQIQHR